MAKNPLMAVKRAKQNGNGRSHSLYLGVDGGGTKTHIVLMTSKGEVKCEGFSGPANPLRVGVETAVGNILKAVNEACDNGGVSRLDIASATLGLAGVRRADLRQRVRERGAAQGPRGVPRQRHRDVDQRQRKHAGDERTAARHELRQDDEVERGE